MNQSLLQSLYRIMEIAQHDRKTISQVGLKLCEESGKVAHAINSLERAHGVPHRDEDVLEELAKNIMVAISALPKIDKTLDQLQEVLEELIGEWVWSLAKEN